MIMINGHFSRREIQAVQYSGLASASDAAAMTSPSGMRDVSWSEAAGEILTPNSLREMTANNAGYKMDVCGAERPCPAEMTYDLHCAAQPTTPITVHNVTYSDHHDSMLPLAL